MYKLLLQIKKMAYFDLGILLESLTGKKVVWGSHTLLLDEQPQTNDQIEGLILLLLAALLLKETTKKGRKRI